MVEILYSDSFKKSIVKIKNTALKNRIKSQISKIVNDPECGKPLRYNMKNERTIYVRPFRIIYSYNDNFITFLVFEHRDDVYN